MGCMMVVLFFSPKDPPNLRHTIEQFIVNLFYVQIGIKPSVRFEYLIQEYR